MFFCSSVCKWTECAVWTCENKDQEDRFEEVGRGRTKRRMGAVSGRCYIYFLLRPGRCECAMSVCRVRNICFHRETLIDPIPVPIPHPPTVLVHSTLCGLDSTVPSHTFSFSLVRLGTLFFSILCAPSGPSFFSSAVICCPPRMGKDAKKSRDHSARFNNCRRGRKKNIARQVEYAIPHSRWLFDNGLIRRGDMLEISRYVLFCHCVA